MSEEARRAVERRRAEALDRLEGRKPLVNPALSAGRLADIDVGWEVWSPTFDTPGVHPDDTRMCDDANPCGGIVVDITRTVDPDTGEKIVVYHTWDYTRPAWQARAALRCVDPATVTTPNTARLRAAWRRMCREVGEQTGPLTHQELRLLTDAHRLAVVEGRKLP